MFKFLKEKIGSFLGSRLRSLLGKKIDAQTIDELEELLYEADLGSESIKLLINEVQKLYLQNPKISANDLIMAMQEILIKELTISSAQVPLPSPDSPHVTLIVGVNGNGKTTSVAKLANHYRGKGESVLVAAADTFRAAAVEQLEIWAKRSNVDIVKGKQGADSASVVFDAIEAAKKRSHQRVIVDTAGRLHTKNDLMQELQKIGRVCGKAQSGAPHETLLVLDATIGQNGITQAEIFHKYTPLTGLILTKLDGTAKGGSIVTIQKKLCLPIKYVGVGEGLNDLQPFNAKSFVQSLLSTD